MQRTALRAAADAGRYVLEYDLNTKEIEETITNLKENTKV